MTAACHICQHGEAFHDRWGICGIPECGPCYKNSECPRCKHVFFEHSITDVRVMCTIEDCHLLTCYDSRHPEKPMFLNMNHPTTQNVIPMEPRRVQATYEEALAAHPLVIVAATTVTPLPVIDDDPQIKPGLWKQYKENRTYSTELGGYIEVDINEKNENGSFKRHAMGRTWDTKYKGYTEDTPPAPPERGFLD